MLSIAKEGRRHGSGEGLLRVSSTIDLSQFWPNGKSDADTATRINLPNDAFDMFGRLIGDIFFRNGGKTISIAQLAAQHGWALPAYYNSMNPDEILTLHRLSEQARTKRSGIWPTSTRWSAN